MPLRLGQIPDRTLKKITFAAEPDLLACLEDYAKVYRQTYGEQQAIETIIPAMLAEFINGDAAFKRARKSLHQPSNLEDHTHVGNR